MEKMGATVSTHWARTREAESLLPGLIREQASSHTSCTCRLRPDFACQAFARQMPASGAARITKAQLAGSVPRARWAHRALSRRGLLVPLPSSLRWFTFYSLSHCVVVYGTACRCHHGRCSSWCRSWPKDLRRTRASGSLALHSRCHAQTAALELQGSSAETLVTATSVSARSFEEAAGGLKAPDYSPQGGKVLYGNTGVTNTEAWVISQS